MKRVHALTPWLAIVALLIDALLPTAVAAAAPLPSDLEMPALCGAAASGQQPAHPAPALPGRHCALCGTTAAPPPYLPSGSLAPIAIAAVVAAPLPVAAKSVLALYPAARPRAPPQAV